MALKPKQRAFVKEYLKDKNAARAARDAGYSKKTARTIGNELLTFPDVRKAVDEGLKKLEAKLDISAERTIKRIAEFAFDKKTIKAADTLKACDMLGKHFKLFTDVQEISGKDGAPLAVVMLPVNQSEAKPDDEPAE